MKKVFKYPIKAQEVQKVSMPLGAEIILVGDQDGQVCVWAVVNIDNPDKDKVLHLRGTGHELPKEDVFHVGSFQKGFFVFHLFEEV